MGSVDATKAKLDLARKTHFTSILKLKNEPIDVVFGVAASAEEVDMQAKFTFFFTIISRSFSIENSMVDR